MIFFAMLLNLLVNRLKNKYLPLLYVHYSIGIILMGKRELVTLLNLFSLVSRDG